MSNNAGAPHDRPELRYFWPPAGEKAARDRMKSTHHNAVEQASIEKATGKKAIIEQLPEQLGDVPKTFADISKAKKLLGYAPTTKLNEGLEKFYKWFSQHNELLLK